MKERPKRAQLRDMKPRMVAMRRMAVELFEADVFAVMIPSRMTPLGRCAVLMIAGGNALVEDKKERVLLLGQGKSWAAAVAAAERGMANVVMDVFAFEASKWPPPPTWYWAARPLVVGEI